MKKKDLVLDFTSLLDVIMIILFVVISNMGQASLDAKEAAEAKMEENIGIQQNLSDTQQTLSNLQNDYNELIISNEKLQNQLDELLLENNLYKAKAGKTDIEEKQLYESLMNQSKKITLICEPYINPNKSDENAVEITIYSAETGDEQKALDVVTFTHNFDLTRNERSIKNAEMQADMYRALEKIIKDNDLKFALITVVYMYNDKNFSQTDLNNIIGAVEDIERKYSITCYIDKIKK